MVTVVAPCSVVVVVAVITLRSVTVSIVALYSIVVSIITLHGATVTVVAPHSVTVAIVMLRRVTVTLLHYMVEQSWLVVAVIAITIIMLSSLHIIAIMLLLL